MYFLRILFLSIVFIGYSSSMAGVFEDYWAAVRKDNPDKVLQLLLAGFDPNTVDDKGNTALILSLSEGGLRVADVMLSLDQVEVNRVNLLAKVRSWWPAGGVTRTWFANSLRVRQRST